MIDIDAKQISHMLCINALAFLLQMSGVLCDLRRVWGVFCALLTGLGLHMYLSKPCKELEALHMLLEIYRPLGSNM